MYSKPVIAEKIGTFNALQLSKLLLLFLKAVDPLQCFASYLRY